MARVGVRSCASRSTLQTEDRTSRAWAQYSTRPRAASTATQRSRTRRAAAVGCTTLRVTWVPACAFAEETTASKRCQPDPHLLLGLAYAPLRMKVVILAGGFGTRISEETQV